MDKLLNPQEVKKYYRKATMLCHPDKVRNNEGDPDKVYIANRCFAAITEAYNIFKVRFHVCKLILIERGRYSVIGEENFRGVSNLNKFKL